MAVSLTPIAFERVQRFVAQTPGALGLRFGVTRTGCSGWGHVTDLARDERDSLRLNRLALAVPGEAPRGN